MCVCERERERVCVGVCVRERVSNLVYYAQSTITAISGRGERERVLSVREAMAVRTGGTINTRKWIDDNGSKFG